MSYGILYRNMNLLLADGTIVPVSENGDNNVYEYGGGRRARDWSSWSYCKERKLSYEPSELLSAFEKSVEEQYPIQKASQYEFCRPDDIKDFKSRIGYWFCMAVSGKHCNDTSYADIMGWLRKGIEQSATFDELRSMAITVCLSWWEKQPDGDTKHKVQDVSSEQELRGMWELLTDQGNQPHVCYRGVSDKAYSAWVTHCRLKKGKATRGRYVLMVDGKYVCDPYKWLHGEQDVSSEPVVRFSKLDAENIASIILRFAWSVQITYICRTN